MNTTQNNVERLRLGGGETVSFQTIVEAGKPVILQGLVSDWPIVKAANQSDDAVVNYLNKFYSGEKFIFFQADKSIDGKFGYNHDCTGFNFESGVINFDSFLEKLLESRVNRDGASFYIGSSSIDRFFPNLRQENDLLLYDPSLASKALMISAWIGNQTTASAHYDASHNIAVCAAGRRRFTLFPPSQIENLYPGPIEMTPGGQVISLVDFKNPDFSRHPKFRTALDYAVVADLEPGDVLVYPSMWWHQVEAQNDFNILINYWWNDMPDYCDSPGLTLLHGLMSLRGRSTEEKLAWRAVFDHYLFSEDTQASAHIPEPGRGVLGALDEKKVRRLRSLLLQKLNR